MPDPIVLRNNSGRRKRPATPGSNEIRLFNSKNKVSCAAVQNFIIEINPDSKVSSYTILMDRTVLDYFRTIKLSMAVLSM